MIKRPAPGIRVDFRGLRAEIRMNGVTYGTDAATARGLVNLASAIRATRLQAEWAQGEGDQAEADRLKLWEIETMQRMHEKGCDDFVAALIEDQDRQAR